MGESSDSKKPSTVLVVLLVVAAGIVVFLVGGLWWFRRRQYRSKSREEESMGQRDLDAQILPPNQQSIMLESTRNSSVNGFGLTDNGSGIPTHRGSGTTDLSRADYSPPSMIPAIPRPSYDADTSKLDATTPQPDFSQSASIFRPGSQIRLMPETRNIDAELSRFPPSSQSDIHDGQTPRQHSYSNPRSAAHNSFPIITSLRNQHLSRLQAPFEMPADIEFPTHTKPTSLRGPYRQATFTSSTSCLELDTNPSRSFNRSPGGDQGFSNRKGKALMGDERQGPRHMQSDNFSQRPLPSVSPDSLSYLRPSPLHIRKTQSGQLPQSTFNQTRYGDFGSHGNHDSDEGISRHRPLDINANSSFLDLSSDQDGHYESIHLHDQGGPSTNAKVPEISDTHRRNPLGRRDDPKDSFRYSLLPVSDNDLGERSNVNFRHNRGTGQLPVESLIRESFQDYDGVQEGTRQEGPYGSYNSGANRDQVVRNPADSAAGNRSHAFDNGLARNDIRRIDSSSHVHTDRIGITGDDSMRDAVGNVNNATSNIVQRAKHIRSIPGGSRVLGWTKRLREREK